MTTETLKGLKVAILVTDGFEQIELERPRKALDDAGAQTQIVSPKAERVRAWKFREWGEQFRVDVPLDQAKPQDFDALLLPGGLVNLDALRVQPKAMAFAKAFFDARKPVAAICRGPWTITEINAARGRLMTSCSSLRIDLENAGADWIDQEVVVDRNLVTGRSPSDIPTFNREMIKVFSAAVRGSMPREVVEKAAPFVDPAGVCGAGSRRRQPPLEMTAGRAERMALDKETATEFRSGSRLFRHRNSCFETHTPARH